jgi:hypothetical protein
MCLTRLALPLFFVSLELWSSAQGILVSDLHYFMTFDVENDNLVPYLRSSYLGFKYIT